MVPIGDERENLETTMNSLVLKTNTYQLLTKTATKYTSMYCHASRISMRMDRFSVSLFVDFENHWRKSKTAKINGTMSTVERKSTDKTPRPM
jgi:hypothetical protein